MAHLFICPNCGSRTTATERNAGLPQPAARAARSAASASCSSCSTTTTRRPNAAFFVCDQQGRVIGCGRGSSSSPASTTSGSSAARSPTSSGCSSTTAPTTSAPSSSGACAQLGKPVEVNAEGDLPAKATADLFPAYDDDGGLLLVLTPSEVAADADCHQSASMTDRRRNVFILLLVARAVAASVCRDLHEADEARPRPAGRRRARLPGQADPAAADGHPGGADRAIDIMRERVDRSASPSPRSSARARTRSPSPARRQERRARGRSRSARSPSCSSTTGSRTSSARTASPTRTTRSPAARSGRSRGVSYDAVRRASQVPGAERRQQRRPPTRAATTLRQGRQEAAHRGRREDTRGGPARRSATRRQRARAPRSSRSTPGTVVVQAEQAASADAPDGRDRLVLRPRRQRRAHGHGHQEPGAELRPGRRRQRQPIVTFDFTDKGREAWQDVTRARSPSAARDNPLLGRRPAEPPRQHFAIVLDNELDLGPVHRLPARTRTASTAATARRSRAASRSSPRRTWRTS